MKLTTLRALGVLMCLGLAGLASSCTQSSKKPTLIGFSIDDMRLERWARDRDFFDAAATKLGAKVLVQSANGRR